MRNALIAGIVAAVVGAGSAGAASWAAGGGTTAPAGRARPAHPAPLVQPHPDAPHHPAPPRTASRVPSNAGVQELVAAWSTAHPGWKSPADMSHSELLQAEIEHPAVYAPDLSRASKARRILDVYGAYASIPPALLAQLRQRGFPIPAGIPYAKPSARPGAQPSN